MAPKKQTQKMSLGDFLGDQSLGSWADEMEDMPVASESRTGYGGDRRAFSSAPSFGGDRGFTGGERPFAVREQLPLPTKPPYTAHLGNLPFDATNGDIEDFFGGCEVTNIRIVEDKMDRKPKGFGYVEFASLDGLKKALDLNGSQFQGRGIRISVADPPKDRPEARELNDWTRKGPLPELPGQQQRRASDRAGFNNYEAAPTMERGGSRRGAPPFEGDGKIRDFNNWERKGPLSPAPSAGPPVRDGGRVRSNEGARERKLSPSWGEGRSQDGSRPPKGEIRERPQVERQPTAADLDNQWRARMKPDPAVKSSTPTPEPSAPSSPAQPAAPAMRPRLNLAKRTVSEAEPSPGLTSDSKSSPFGAARPIDTAAREREVEEKRQLVLRQKKEADDKAREEKKAKEAASKSATTEKTASPNQDNDKESGEEEEDDDAPRPSYQILQRLNDEEGENEAADAPANGDIVEDKAVKPKEFIRDPPKGPKNDRGNWRRKSSTPGTPISPKGGSSTKEVEEDGWSTVPSKDKRSKGGRGGARAVAS